MTTETPLKPREVEPMTSTDFGAPADEATVEKTATPDPAKPADKKPAKDDSATDEHPLSPVLEQAIRQKEKEVTEARREGIKLLEDYLRDSTRSNEQAEALYKLAELYWEEAKAVYLDKIPKGAEVSQGASKTLEEIGVTAAIEESGDYDAIRPKTRKLDYSTEEGRAIGRKMGAVPDWWLNSVAALTEDGRMVIASNTGSQLGPVAFGAGHVIFVVGTQKIVKDLDEAMRRLEDHVLPLESERLHAMYGVPSNISKVLIINKEIRAGRFTVVLVREPVGF